MQADDSDPENIKGFLSPAEGEALQRHAGAVAHRGAVLEVGSYCGKSTVYLGRACKAAGGSLFAVDHHRGSEEHQPGELFHDPSLFDTTNAQFDSFAEFRRNIRRAGLEDTVIPMVAPSALCARQWQTPLAMVFIDGGHSLAAALSDYRSWATHIIAGGILAVHDLFPAAETGGQAPIAIYRLALASGLFEEVERVDSLGIARRIGA